MNRTITLTLNVKRGTREGRQKRVSETSIPMTLTRSLTMQEVKLLWDAERALNALPFPLGTRVVFDLDIT